MLQAYEGYIENGRFYPLGQPLDIQGRRRAIITVFDEPHRQDTNASPAVWLAEFNRLLEDSGDEELSMADFPRANFTRENLEVEP